MSGILFLGLSLGFADTLSYSLEPPGPNPSVRQVSVRDEETKKFYSIDTRERINCFRFDFWVPPEGTNFLSALSVSYITLGSNSLPQDFNGSLSLVAYSRRTGYTTNDIIGRGAWKFDYNPETTLTNRVEQHSSRKQFRSDSSIYFCTLIFDTPVSPSLNNGDPPTEIIIYLSSGNELNIIRWPESAAEPQAQTKLSIERPVTDTTSKTASARPPLLEINLQEGFVVISSQSPLPTGSSLEEISLATTNGIWKPTLNATPIINGWRLPTTSESKVFRLKIPTNTP